MATATPSRRIERPVLFVCDLQEKFRPAVHAFDEIILTTRKLLRFAEALSIPVKTTTQNAARLGPTVPELDCPAPHIDKTAFSMFIPPLSTSLAPNSSVAIVGIETHICVTQTALDLLAAGHKVYVIADGVGSCNREEVPLALQRLTAAGVIVTSSEGWMYEVMGDAAIPEFKSVIKIVKETGADTKTALKALLPRI
ncbi:related to isochorismatase family hydrolase [Cephalotrichum gorgonifer]|uniref:Related to isochorismatase family hydrolase n=1 Tax=Cephalotrichum gorgonifer TaxID=2041049 RepID=A0AAE8SRL6_9PEZI|nr:related to isochorismatase family hydrolase [Cephalotrichum gorgonifer]